MPKNDVTPIEVIDGFLSAIRDVAAENTAFRARLIEILGVNVVYEGEEQFEGANPAVQAARWSQDAFSRIWSGAKLGEIKAVLKDHHLATPMDMKYPNGKNMNKKALIDLLYERGLAKAEELGLV